MTTTSVGIFRSKPLRIAALLLAGAAMYPASAQSAPKAVVQAEANTPSSGLAQDLLVRSDRRLAVTTKHWQIGLEQNVDKLHQKGNDFALVSYMHKTGSWLLNPGMRVDAKGTLVPYIGVTKQIGAGSLTTLTGPGTDRFYVLRSRYNGPTVDAGAGLKVFDWAKGTKGIEGILGMHAKDGAQGAWIAKSATKGAYAAAVTVDRKDFGLSAFGRKDLTKQYLVLQTAAESGGKRMGGAFSHRTGFDNARHEADQMLHPLSPQIPSYLVNGGRYAAEFGTYQSKAKSYTQGQAGMRIKRFGNGSSLYAGAGAKHDHAKGWQPVAEAAYAIPVGEKGCVSLEMRASPNPTLSLRFGKTF